MGKFWQSITQAIENLNTPYEAWWDSMTDEDRVNYLLYNDTSDDYILRGY